MKLQLCALVVGLVIVVSSAQAATYNLPANGTITLQGPISAPFNPISQVSIEAIPPSGGPTAPHPEANWYSFLTFYTVDAWGNYSEPYRTASAGCFYGCSHWSWYFGASASDLVGLFLNDRIRTLIWSFPTGVNTGVTLIPHIMLSLPDGVTLTLPDGSLPAGVTITQTPLPAAAWLFLTALAGLGLCKRRTKA
jgi:hypothetical protein